MVQDIDPIYWRIRDVSIPWRPTRGNRLLWWPIWDSSPTRRPTRDFNRDYSVLTSQQKGPTCYDNIPSRYTTRDSDPLQRPQRRISVLFPSPSRIRTVYTYFNPNEVPTPIRIRLVTPNHLTDESMIPIYPLTPESQRRIGPLLNFSCGPDTVLRPIP